MNSLNGVAAGAIGSEVEVLAKATRRRFTAEYKLKILKEAAACTQPGELGALLRREGLYSSHLTSWRRIAENAELAALAPRKRGRKPKLDERDLRLAELVRENEKLKARAERAELLVEIQKNSPAPAGSAL